jgi:iron(III) transport system substrate-binding protein
MSTPPTLSRGAAISGASAALLAAASRPAFAQAGAMAALVSAAKAEGSVVVDGPPIDETRDVLTAGFQKAYGIPVTYISSGSAASGARVRAERAAGKYLLDVFISGSDTPTLTFLPSGWLDRVEPILVEPDVIDKRKWQDGHLWYIDPQNTILRVLKNVVPEISINTKYVKRGEIPTWKTLLEPKWQGKYVAKDPASSGAGASLVSYFYINFGADFVKKFYQDQKPALSRDPRQEAQWLAQGNYPVAVGADLAEIMRFQQQGYPVEPIFPTDAPSVLTGSWGLVCLMNKAPHSNAAKLFINWLAGPQAEAAFAKSTQSLSLRTDVKSDDLPSFIFPQKGTKYMDTYSYDFITHDRDAALTKVRDLLGE